MQASSIGGALIVVDWLRCEAADLAVQTIARGGVLARMG